MSARNSARDQIEYLMDALDEVLLRASPADLREELALEGLNEAQIVQEMDAILVEAKKAAGKLRMAEAKAAVADRSLHAFSTSEPGRERIRTKLATLRSGTGENAEGMMLAARKGKGLSVTDEDGILDDWAQLEALENENDEE